MPLQPSGSISDRDLGRAAAEAILASGTDEAVFDERLTPEFANAAVDAISDYFESQGFMRQMMEGASRGASQLNVEEFHGLIEVIQNADDVGANEVRIAIRRKADGAELLVAHDGGRVLLRHAIAMSFAFVTTKANEAKSKGRFGIGLKTLARLGSNLEVHCHPYHFIARGSGPRSAPAATAIPGFYNPRSGETLLRLALNSGFDDEEFRSWFQGLSAAHLLFLDSVASVRLVDLPGRARTLSMHGLDRSPIKTVRIAGPRGPLNAAVTKLKDRQSRSSWTRVTVEFSVPQALARTYKATGPTSPISIAIGAREPVGRLFAGLPLRVQSRLPFNLNAQFDPDTARVQVQHIKWNEWLFQRAADLISSTARWQFESAPAGAWRWVPLAEEGTSATDPWLDTHLGRMVETAQRDLVKRLRIRSGNRDLSITMLVYEAQALEGLLTAEDQGALRPGYAAVPLALRGAGGRWRKVLDDLGASQIVSIADAVSMFDWDEAKLGSRSGEWHVGLAARGLAAKLEDKLDQSSSVRLAAGGRSRPPTANDSYVFASAAHAVGLAADLGLVRAIDDAYFEETAAASDVRRWLERRNRLKDGVTAFDALEQLARGGPLARDVDDRQLTAIRDALASLNVDDRRMLGPDIGEAILVDGFEWRDSKRHSIQVRPVDAYLSATIDSGGRESWATAADRTPRLRWIHSRYKTVLQGPASPQAGVSDDKVIGARALFTLLGAESAPRLVEPPNPASRYRDIAHPIRTTPVGAQSEALDALSHYVTHLQNDWDCPDLDAVVADLVKRGAKVRRPRSRALLKTMARAWNRLYADQAVATAVYSSGSWQYAGEVPATWLSNLMTEPWLSNKFGRAKSPRLLALQSARMLDAFGPNNALYGAEFDGMEAHPHVLEALGVQTFPHASRVVLALGELRRKGAAGPATARDATVLYEALGQHTAGLSGPITPESRIDDLSVSQVRARFGIATGKPGLILVGGRWLAPSAVFRGLPIFGSRRPFVPDRTRSDRLWEVLNIQPPSIQDCVDVLSEMADDPPDARDEAVLIDVYRHVATHLAGADLAEREALLRVPLWDGSNWNRTRPIYAVDDPALTAALSTNLPTWHSPASFASLGTLPLALGVQLLRRSAFVPSGIGPRAALEGKDIEPVFASAVRHLKSRLQRNDPGLYRANTVGWDALERAQVLLAPSLALEIRVGDDAFTVPARAHVRPDPLPVLVCLADSGEAGSDETAGRALAAIFNAADEGPALDREKVALAWAAAWRLAALGELAETIDLPSDSKTQDDVLSGMVADLARGKRRGRVFESLTKLPPSRTRGAHESIASINEEDVAIQVRELKGGSDLEVVRWEIVEPPAGPKRANVAARTVTLRPVPTSTSGPVSASPANRTAPRGYSELEIETLATNVLRRVLQTIGRSAEDFRAIRRLGADVVDDLGRFFEIKASFGPGADSISLTAHEAKRAQVAKTGEFFLAIVSGLEKGYQTQVRIIPDPLDALEWGENGTLALAGIRKAGMVVDVELV